MRVARQSPVHRGAWSRLIVHGRWSSIMGSFLEQRPSQKLKTDSASEQVAGRVARMMMMTMAVSLPNGCRLRVGAGISFRSAGGSRWLAAFLADCLSGNLAGQVSGRASDRPGLTGDSTRSGRDNPTSPRYVPGRPVTRGS